MSTLLSAVFILAVVLLFLCSFLAAAETSLSRIDAYRAQALKEESRRGSVALAKLLESPDHFSGHLNSLLLLLLASQIVWATSLAYLFLHYFTGPVVILAIVLEIGVGYVIAEALPKTVAIQHPERIALLTAPLMLVLSRIIPMRSLTRPLIAIANLLAPGRGFRQGPSIYEQQILAIADSAAAEKIIERDEHELIHSVIEFSSTVAREVMVPRTAMVTLHASATASEALDLALEKGFSRFPVHGDESDGVTGIVFTKDVMRAFRENNSQCYVGELQRDAKYIPETKRVAELLREMQVEKSHMAIVVDEHGSVVGLVTLEDLLEEVVGEIADEYDADELPQVEKLGETEWRVDARMPIDELNQELNLDFPHGDWDTLGGLLIDTFERIPGRGEATDFDGCRVWVEQLSGRRVSRVRIKLVPKLVVDAKASAATAE